MRIVIDDDVCSGHGRCHSLWPDFFAEDALGRGVVIVDEVSESLRDAAERAVASCPERAISLAEGA